MDRCFHNHQTYPQKTKSLHYRPERGQCIILKKYASLMQWRHLCYGSAYPSVYVIIWSLYFGVDMLKSIEKNRGAVSIEASLVLPLFLFTMLFFIYLSNVSTVKAVVYEGCIETAEYMAEYAYLTDKLDKLELMNHPMAALRFREYVDDTALLEKYVVGGSNGISFIGSKFPDDDGYIDLKVTYFIKLNLPILGRFHTRCEEHIKQKAYVGRTNEDEGDSEADDDRYVYVAKNGVVYHESRSCTYLMPDIKSGSKESAEKMGYKKCKYCGNASGDSVYITTDGNRYHSRSSCSRLRRTVYRKKLSEVNLPPCSKCAN